MTGIQSNITQHEKTNKQTNTTKQKTTHNPEKNPSVKTDLGRTEITNYKGKKKKTPQEKKERKKKKKRNF